MNPGGEDSGRSEAQRFLDFSEELYLSGDLEGSKKLAERAIDSDPLVSGADHVLAVADVLLASRRRINNQIDWYAILQLDPSDRDPAAVRRHYRRLALVLRPDRNRRVNADAASKLVAEAWSVLSDPSKKSLLDAELEISAAHLGPQKNPLPGPAAVEPDFWTACPSCFHVFQYEGAYKGRRLRCTNCCQAFNAVAIEAAPPIVPGTDKYYCSWGFFPLGFPADVKDGFKPLYPMSPWSPGNHLSQPSDCRGMSMNGSDRNEASPACMKKGTMVSPPSTKSNVVAKKMVVSNFKKRIVESEERAKAVGVGTEARPVVIDINEDIECSESNGIVGEEDAEMAAEEEPDYLLSFLSSEDADDDIQIL